MGKYLLFYAIMRSFKVIFLHSTYEFIVGVGVLKVGLTTPIDEHEVYKLAIDISMALLEEVCTKLEVTDQPLECSTQEIVKPIVIAHKLAKLIPKDKFDARFDE